MPRHIKVKYYMIICVAALVMFIMLSPGIILTLPIPPPPTPKNNANANANNPALQNMPNTPASGSSSNGFMAILTGNACQATSFASVIVHSILFTLILGVFLYIFIEKVAEHDDN